MSSEKTKVNSTKVESNKLVFQDDKEKKDDLQDNHQRDKRRRGPGYLVMYYLVAAS